MINPIDFLWKQLRGPQITAFTQGLFEWFKSSFDPILDYWKNFSIETASNEHLTTIGAIQGIARPMLAIVGTQFFLFTEVPEEGTYYPSVPWTESSHGVSDLRDITVGGKFIDVHDDPDHHPKDIAQIPPILFRAILRANSNSEAVPGSLAWLDDIMYALWSLEHDGEQHTPGYTFKILEEEDLVQYYTRACGDILVNIGVIDDYTYAAEIVAELELLGKTLYYPTPTIYATANS